MVHNRKITFEWARSHPEKTKKESEFNFIEKGNFLANFAAEGLISEIQKRHRGAVEEQVEFDLVAEKLRTNTRYTILHGGIPVNKKQIRAMNEQEQLPVYLAKRETTSADDPSGRGIKWTELSVELSAKVMNKVCVSNVSITKTVYDLYDDDLHKDQLNVRMCPLCKLENDTTEHLFHCKNEYATSIARRAWEELQREPPGQKLEELDAIVAVDLKQLLGEIFKENSQARIGLFNRDQRERLVMTLGRSPGKRLINEAKTEIFNRTAIMAMATVDLIYKRNECKHGVKGWEDRERKRPLKKKPKGEKGGKDGVRKTQLPITKFLSKIPNSKLPESLKGEGKPLGTAGNLNSRTNPITQPVGPVMIPHTQLIPTTVVDAERREIIDRMRLNNSEKVLVEIGGAPITERIFHCLRDKTWLNDEVINAYGQLMSRELQRRIGGKKVLILNIAFMNALFNYKSFDFANYNHKNVERWFFNNKGNNIDIFRYEAIYVPTHIPGHWLALEINMVLKIIGYVNSYGDDPYKEEFLKAIFQFIKDQYQFRVKRKMTKVQQDEWTVVDIDSPQQHPNKTDCGVFVLLNIQLRAQNQQLDYGDQGQQLQVTSAFRYAIADAILREASGPSANGQHTGGDNGGKGDATGGVKKTNGDDGTSSSFGMKGFEIETYRTTTAVEIRCYAFGSEATTVIKPNIDMTDQLKGRMKIGSGDIKIYKVVAGDREWHRRLGPSNRDENNGMINSGKLEAGDVVVMVEAGGNLQPKILWLPNPGLEAEYCGLREIRGDGKCYYRAVIFRLLEIITESKATNRGLAEGRLKTLVNKLRGSLNSNFGTNYLSLSAQECEAVIARINLTDGICSSLTKLQTEFCYEGNDVDRALVQMCKMMTAEFLIVNRDQIYEGTGTTFEQMLVGFEEGEKTFDQIIALILEEREYSVAACVGASITLRALEVSGSVTSITEENKVLEGLKHTTDESWADIKLLFRRDHYDILYDKVPNQQQQPSSSSTAVAAEESEQSQNNKYLLCENKSSLMSKDPAASLENEVYGLKGD